MALFGLSKIPNLLSLPRGWLSGAGDDRDGG
jgi:hypothetical protein